MIGKHKLVKQVKRFGASKENVSNEIPGELGLTIGGKALVDVTGRPGYVWVRLRNDMSEAVQAYNDQVSPVYGLGVIVVRDPIDKSRWRIKGRDLGRYNSWSSASAYLPAHNYSHSLPINNPGADPVWVYSRQIMPLALVPSGTSGAMSLIVKDFIYNRNSIWRYFSETSTSDLSGYKPSGTNAVFVLVYLDTSDSISYLRGSEFSSATGTANVVPNIPNSPSDCYIPIAGVYLLSGTSSLSWINIYDARPFFSPVVTGSSGGSGGHTIQDEGTPLNQRAGLNFIGPVVWAIDDSANSRTNIIISGSYGHTMQDDGTPLTQRSNLNFVGSAFVLYDNAGGGSTNVSGVSMAMEVQNNGAVVSSSVSKMNFVYPQSIVDNGSGKVTITLPTGSSSSKHIIQSYGVSLPERSKLNFIGSAFDVYDVAGSDATNVSGTSTILEIQDNGTPVDVITKLSFVNAQSIVNNGDGKVTVNLSTGSFSSLSVWFDDVMVANNVTKLSFYGDFEIQDMGGGEVSISLA
jgi:hypothetical protein